MKFNYGIRPSNAHTLEQLKTKKLFIFDIAGVLYKGKEVNEEIGGAAVIEKLRSEDKKIRFLTNSSTDNSATIKEKLGKVGILAYENEIVTSATVAPEYTFKKYGASKYYLIGEEILESEMSKKGHFRSENGPVDFVLIGQDSTLTTAKLDTAVRLVLNGAKIVACNLTRTFATKYGLSISTGAIVKAVEYATRKKAVVVGKPSNVMFRIAIGNNGVKVENAVMIGDEVIADILGAMRIGLDSVFVRSGVDRELPPDVLIPAINNVNDLLKFI